MKTIGIIAEYNPFHKGHFYHISESRRLAGEQAAVVAVMSGDYVQRGEPAVFSKYARAEAACLCGADLVVELPLPWALASAEGFAEGAVQLLGALGADFLSFGCETGNLSELQEVASFLTEPGFLEETKELLKSDPSQSFASARQKTVEKHFERELPLLRKPNSILAVEYLKALRKYGMDVTPLPVLRKGVEHDGEMETEGFLSASGLRKRMRDGETTGKFIPAEAFAVFQRETDAGRAALDQQQQGLLLLSRLRFLKEEDFRCLPDAEEGLGRRLQAAVKQAHSYEGVLAAAATRRFPLARVRRGCIAAALGMGEDWKHGAVPYARVLAFNKTGRILLRAAAEVNRMPLLTKPAHVSGLDERAQHIYAAGADAHDFYTLLFPKEEERICGEDWRKGPFVCD